MSNNPLKEMYMVSPEEKAIFGSNWCGPEELPHMDAILIATYKGNIENDGPEVQIWCTAMPARFYDIKMIHDKGYRMKQDHYLSTGSGYDMARLSDRIAKAISAGMLTIRRH